jgi:hypothetical protein
MSTVLRRPGQLGHEDRRSASLARVDCARQAVVNLPTVLAPSAIASGIDDGFDRSTCRLRTQGEWVNSIFAGSAKRFVG